MSAQKGAVITVKFLLTREIARRIAKPAIVTEIFDDDDPNPFAVAMVEGIVVDLRRPPVRSGFTIFGLLESVCPVLEEIGAEEVILKDEFPVDASWELSLGIWEAIDLGSETAIVVDKCVFDETPHYVITLLGKSVKQVRNLYRVMRSPVPMVGASFPFRKAPEKKA